MKRPMFTWFAPSDFDDFSSWTEYVEYYERERLNYELRVKNYPQGERWYSNDRKLWDYSPEEVKLDISWIGKQLKGLRFAFKDTMDLIESWKKRIDREKTK